MGRKCDVNSVTKLFDGRSAEELQLAANVIEGMVQRAKALEQLEKHPLLAEVHTILERIAKETGASLEDILIAELQRFGVDMPSYELRISKYTEQWKKDNATHRNPDNPEETWYSPDGRGNPPKWIQRLLGKKPDPKKDPEGHKEWMRKLKKFRIDRSEVDMAA
jgi:hypothetical protein